MKLDIIIPQYNETENVIKALLDSINNQSNFDFNNLSVTIVNDCSNTILSKEFLNSFSNLEITYLKNDRNTGPGLAREKGMENTNGDYIMFCDADDALFDEFVLKNIYNKLINESPLYLVTNIAAEVILNGKIEKSLRRGKDTFPWMHGKVYKRSFLRDNDIHFSKNIRHLEDTYFTTCILGVIKNEDICFYDLVSYIWKINEKSLTREKEKYHYSVRTFDEFFNSPKYIYEFLTERKSPMRFNYFISSMFGIYIMLNSNLFDFPELEGDKAEYLYELKEYLKSKKNIFILYNNNLEKIYELEKIELVRRNGIAKVHKNLEDFKKEMLS